MSLDFDLYFPKPTPERYCDHDFVTDGHNICRTCGHSEPELVSPFISYRERSAVNTPYCKTSHFKSKLDELCCTEPVVIPPEVLALCGDTPDAVRSALQKHRLKQHYGRVYIILKQKGICIPTITHQEREQLIRSFRGVVMAFGKTNKANMVSYHFVLSKLLLEIGRADVIPLLFALKNKKKRQEYEDLWDLMESFKCT